MTTVKTNTITHLRLFKSDQFLQSAHLLMTTDDWNSALSFLYYASFHAVMGLLIQTGISVKSHISARRIFDVKYVRSGIINAKDGQFYTHLYKERDKSDHKDFAIFTEEDVLPLLPQTKEFIDVIKRLIHTT